jgi:hypothetical protein
MEYPYQFSSTDANMYDLQDDQSQEQEQQHQGQSQEQEQGQGQRQGQYDSARPTSSTTPIASSSRSEPTQQGQYPATIDLTSQQEQESAAQQQEQQQEFTFLPVQPHGRFVESPLDLE